MVTGFGLETVKGDYRVQISQIRDVARKRWLETTAKWCRHVLFSPFERITGAGVPLTPHRRKGAPCGSLLPAVLQFWNTTLNVKFEYTYGQLGKFRSNCAQRKLRKCYFELPAFSSQDRLARFEIAKIRKVKKLYGLGGQQKASHRITQGLRQLEAFHSGLNFIEGASRVSIEHGWARLCCELNFAS
jgi:hypothetical protein